MTVSPTPIDTVAPRGGWPDHPLFGLENLYRAYRPDRFLAFMVEKPKRREFSAADFRDRVVHQLLVAHLERTWERRVIHDSFACRKGKGTHAGVERLRSFARKVKSNGTRSAWYLPIDVRGFFVTLNRRILWDRLAAVEHDPAVLWLLRLILFHEPTNNGQFRGARRAEFERLPGHVLMLREGPFVETITDGVSAAAIEAWPRRFPLGLLPSGLPVAWIDETGRRPGSIAERALTRRWGAAGALSGR